MRGWQPQKEMFFIWKKWLQCWNWTEQRGRDVRLKSPGATPATPAGYPCQSPQPPCASGSHIPTHLRSTAQTQLDPPKRNLKVTGGRGTQVDRQFPGRGDLEKPGEEAGRRRDILDLSAGLHADSRARESTRALAIPQSQHQPVTSLHSDFFPVFPPTL